MKKKSTCLSLIVASLAVMGGAWISDTQAFVDTSQHAASVRKLDPAQDKYPACESSQFKVREGGSPEEQMCWIHVDRIHPTQLGVGRYQAECNARTDIVPILGDPAQFDAYLLTQEEVEKNGQKVMTYPYVAPAVKGPNGRFFITDKHHFSTALSMAPTIYNNEQGGHVGMLYSYIQVTNDFSRMDEDTFWTKMMTLGWPRNQFAPWAWPFDPQGEVHAPSAIPDTVYQLENDDYRSLSGWVRNRCGYLKTGKGCMDALRKSGECDTKHGKKWCDNLANASNKYYMEFMWGDYLREKRNDESLNLYDASQERIAELLEQGIAQANEKDASSLPGYFGHVAKENKDLKDLGDKLFKKDTGPVHCPKSLK